MNAFFKVIGTLLLLIIIISFSKGLMGAQNGTGGNPLSFLPGADQVQSSSVYSTKVNGVGAKDMLKSGNGMDSMAKAMGAGSDW